MPRIPYRYPPAGVDPIADAIRERRGPARGLTPLDGSLLNAPAIANGWNTLLGATRTKNSIPDDVREMMILRVASHNSANFEWIQHEPVAVKAGCTTAQLAAVRDIRTPLSASTVLTPLHKAALALADDMTTRVKVADSTFDAIRSAFRDNVAQLGAGDAAANVDGFQGEDLVNRKVTEATLTVAVYNMVSRFLVAIDVDDRANVPVPTPTPEGEGEGEGEGSSEHVDDAASLHYPVVSGSSTDAGRGLVQLPDGQLLSTRVHFHSMSAPWIVLVNSLMTNLTMWDAVVPALSARFNILCYDQRGHGSSAVPQQPCSIPELADDVAFLLDSLAVRKAYAVIGVSQGGATALSFGLRHPERYERLVACDTQPSTPAANVAAWDERIALARASGMDELASVTVPRWYGPGSQASEACRKRTEQMVRTTQVEGFVAGARALQSYDLIADGVVESYSKNTGAKYLLLAGEADGKLPETLEAFTAKLREAGARAEFASIAKAGHLPMCDNPEAWLQPVLQFLS
ncbi:alpha/beta-hydrolase [Testicularia cyperi]|uniref:Alpha/beta-hydrolase n=1 Tax=Testicularia cyperi TaxID=1882483 RepID=A0A317XJ16_9BASI|nr:alpha/beta-hydrolase [Testicularia cyperi]